MMKIIVAINNNPANRMYSKTWFDTIRDSATITTSKLPLIKN